MGHYDNCREGYCGKCGAAPGNIDAAGLCDFCDAAKKRKKADKASAYQSVANLLAETQAAASTSYVYENVEVIKTGRKSQRKMSSGKIDELVEITPSDKANGAWKKWVRDDMLFTVM